MSQYLKDNPLSQRQTKVINLVVVLLCVAILVPLLVIAVFDRPSADDFAYSITTHQVFIESGGNIASVLLEAIDTSARYYQSWQGLYTSAFILSLQPAIFGTKFYCLGAFGIIALLIASVLYFVFCIEQRLLKASTMLWPAVGMLIATFCLQAMPYANEGIYWFNGAANYTPFFCFSLITTGLCISAFNAVSHFRYVILLLITSVLSFVISGGNYMPAFFNLMLMVGFAIIGIMLRKKWFVLPALFSIVGFVINALSPGTAIRQSFFVRQGVFSTVVHSAWQFLMDVRQFCDLPFFAILLLLTPLLFFWSRNCSIAVKRRHVFVAAIIICVFAVGTLCVPYYAMGSFGAGRVRDTNFLIDFFLLLAFWTVVVAYIGGRFHSGDAEKLTPRLFANTRTIVAAVCAVLAIIVFWGSSVAGHGNSLIAFKSIVTGESAAYAYEYDEREQSILLSDNGSVQVQLLSLRPELLFFSDFISDNGLYDWSDNIAAYYGVESVEIMGQHEGLSNLG